MPGRPGKPLRDQQEDRFRLVLGLDRRPSERSVRVAVGELFPECVCRFLIVKSNFVFYQRCDYSLARKHRAAFDDSCRGYRVDPHKRRHLNGQLTNEMVCRCLAGVISNAARFGHHGISAGCDYDACRQTLALENIEGFIGYRVGAGHVDRECACPLAVLDSTLGVWWNEYSSSHDNCVQTSVSEHRVPKHGGDAFAIGDVARQPYSRSAVAYARAGYANPFA